MRLLRDIGIAVIGAAVVGLIVGYSSNHVLLGLWIGLATGVLLVATALVVERHRRGGTQPDSAPRELLREGHRVIDASPGYVSHRQQVVNECIERGVALRNGINPQSDSMQTNWIGSHAEEWAKETWQLLGAEVPEWRGLFHMQTHAGFDAERIIGYLDMRLAELRTILGKLG